MGIVEKVAMRFIEQLISELEPHEIGEVVELNFWEENPDVCHSHDFTDANELMCNAFEDATGTRFFQNDKEHQRIWNLAWQCAKRKLPSYI